MQKSFFKYRLGTVQSISFGLTVISVFNNTVFEVLLKLGTFSKVRIGRSIVLHSVAVMLNIGEKSPTFVQNNFTPLRLKLNI